jgi:glycosyltransferase involved in cell wall biosynthesis
MKIGIDGSRAFLKKRTGIEEYSYQVIKNLRDKLDQHFVVLYLRPKQIVDFSLPKNWQIKKIKFPRLWTQVGLSLQLFFDPVNVLFVPAHTVPLFHPRKTVVTIHGLEYEIMPEAYSLWERIYMRFSIKNSCRWVEKIISVSKNTKQDLIRLYDIPQEKIMVIHEGYEEKIDREKIKIKEEFERMKPYLLFIGRLEKRKNIEGIIAAFEFFKQKNKTNYKLVLGGKFGYGEYEIRKRLEKSEYKKDIILLGFVSEEEKWQLFKQAGIFLFPTFYEGFGIPILEAQSFGLPVITSNCSSFLEVSEGSAFLVDPNETEMIGKAIGMLVSNEALRDDIIKKGNENIKRFSWEKCSQQIAMILTER